MKKLLFCLLLFPAIALGQAANQFRQVTFNNLGVPSSNNVRYCVDCDISDAGVCTSGGSGAYAYRRGGVWRCSLGANTGGTGTGDVTSDTATANVGQGVVFSDTTGKQIGRFMSSGWVKATGGTFSTVASIDLAADVTGNLPVANLASGVGATSLTYWRGDGTWGTPAGSGTVTSVVANNSVSGLTMTISNPATTPTINLSGVPNIAASNVTSGIFSTARLGSGSPSSANFLRGDGTWASAGVGTGTVTSVAASVPGEFLLAGSPITTSGTLAITKNTQTANTIWAGPTSGGATVPTFRALVSADIPAVTEAKLSFTPGSTANNSAVGTHGLLAALSGNGSDCLRGDGSFSTCPGAGTGGDFSTNTTTSVAQQVVVASGSGGKTGEFAAGSGIALLTSGVLSYKTNPAGAFVGTTDTQTLTNKVLTTPTIGDFTNATHAHTNAASGGQLTLSAFTSTTGSGAVVGATSPTLVTPTLGAATATSVNKLTLTAPAASATLTIDNGKTLRTTSTLTLSGTDATVMTFPSASGSVLTADSTATLTNKSISASQVNSGTLGTARLGSGPADSTTFLRGDSTWQAVTGGGTPGGSVGQFQFNNTTFGGAANFLYNSTTGQITANQLGNGNNIFYGKRVTDSSPTGNLLLFQNQAASVDLFKVDVSGAVTLNSVTGIQDVLTVSKAVQLTTGTRPVCSVTYRGTIWYVNGSAGVADSLAACVKNSSDVYAWINVASIP